MFEDTQEVIEHLKNQIEQVKQQDLIFEKIEIYLIQMKEIAQYAADHKLTDEEITKMNYKIQDHHRKIKELESKFVLFY